MKDGDIPAHLRKALDRLAEVIDRIPDARSPDPYDAITIMATEDGSRANKRVCLFVRRLAASGTRVGLLTGPKSNTLRDLGTRKSVAI